MAGEWITFSVQDIAKRTATGPFGSAISSKYFVDSGVPVIRGSNLSQIVTTRLDDSGLVFISEEKAREFGRSEARPGDLIFTCWGTIDQVGLIDSRATYDRYIVSNKQMLLTPDESRADSLFLYYYFASPQTRAQIVNEGIGSSVPGFNLGQLRSFEVPLPPLAEQKAIAGVLGALDDKIELNRRMNATLEAMARALFQSWFVDFDPVRAKLDGREPVGLDPATAALFPDSLHDSAYGHIPKGWETGSILRQADLLSGGTPKTDVPNYWNGDVPWASAKDVSQCGEAFLVSTERTITKQGVEESSTKIIPANATVVVARGATTGRLTMFGHAMAMNQTCYGLRSKVGAPFALYCNVRYFIERLVQGGHGSIFDTITTSTFESTDVLLAPKEILVAFDKQVAPLFQQIHANLLQSRTLATLRDTLLPKLLSGEITILTT